MSEDTSSPGADFSSEFNQFFKEAGVKFEKEHYIEKAVRGLRTLLEEKNIDDDMPMYRIKEIIVHRLEDLRRAMARTEPNSRENKELLGYIYSLYCLHAFLEIFRDRGMNPDSRADFIICQFEACLSNIEEVITEDEERRRRENERNIW